MRRIALLIATAAALTADPPAAVMRVFTYAAEALANGDSAAFLEQFDKDTPNYAALRDNIEGLLGAHQVGSTVEVVMDEGDERKHTLELDWLLIISGKGLDTQTETRRKVIQCTVERRGRQWKITAIAPLDFFAY